MAWAFVQSNHALAAGAATSIATTLGSNTPAGHLVVVNVAGNASSATIADSASNTWTQVFAPGGGQWAWYSVITNPGTLTITVTPNASSFMNIGALDFTATNPSLVTPPAIVGGTSTLATANAVTWTGNAVVIAATILNTAGGTATAASGFTLDYSGDFSAGVHFGSQVEYQLNLTGGTSTPTVSYASSCSWGIIGYAFVEAATSATLTGPNAGAPSVQSGAFTVTLNGPAAAGGITVTLSSTGTGDTFQSSVGGSNVTTITIAQGSLSGTFYLTPTATTGLRSVSIATSPSLTLSGTPINFTAYTTWNYFSAVQGFLPSLSTVGYQVFNPNGTAFAPRKTSGVAALGATGYAATVAVPLLVPWSIQWDDGGTPTNYGYDTAAVPYTQTVNSNVIQQASVSVSATCAAPGTSNTIVHAATDSTVTGTYNDQMIILLAGTGAGQQALIQSYNGPSQTSTIYGTWVTIPDATTVYQMGGLGRTAAPFKRNQPNNFIIALLDINGNPYAQPASTIAVTREIDGAGGGTTGAAGTLTQIGATNRYNFAGTSADFGGTNVTFTFTGSGGGQTVQAATWSVNTQP